MPEKDIDEMSLTDSIDPSETECVSLISDQQNENQEPTSDSTETMETEMTTVTEPTKEKTSVMEIKATPQDENVMEVSSTQPIVVSDVSENESETLLNAKKPLQDASVTQSSQDTVALKDNVLKEVCTNIIQEDISPASVQDSPITGAKFVIIKDKPEAEHSIEDMNVITASANNSADDHDRPAPVTPVKTPPRVNLSPRKELARSGERVGSFNRRSAHCPPPAMKYRLMCQCGAKNCRKYLY